MGCACWQKLAPLNGGKRFPLQKKREGGRLLTKIENSSASYPPDLSDQNSLSFPPFPFFAHSILLQRACMCECNEHSHTPSTDPPRSPLFPHNRAKTCYSNYSGITSTTSTPARPLVPLRLLPLRTGFTCSARSEQLTHGTFYSILFETIPGAGKKKKNEKEFGNRCALRKERKKTAASVVMVVGIHHVPSFFNT